MPEEPVETTMDISASTSSSQATPAEPMSIIPTNIKRELREPVKNDIPVPINKHTQIKKPLSPVHNQLIQSANIVDDDDQIELILLEVQSEQSRFQEILTQLQDHSKKLLNLK